MQKLTSTWLRAAIIRAIKTMAQTLIGMITVGAAIYEVNWGYILSVALVAGIVSLLTSLSGLPETGFDGTLEQLDLEAHDEGEFDLTLPNLREYRDGQIVRLKIRK